MSSRGSFDTIKYHQSDGSFDVISSISSVHYYDSYNFISNFTSTLQKDYTI